MERMEGKDHLHQLLRQQNLLQQQWERGPANKTTAGQKLWTDMLRLQKAQGSHQRRNEEDESLSFQ